MRTTARRSRRRGGGGGRGGFSIRGPIVGGALTGAATQLIGPQLGPMGPALVTLGGGYWLNNPTLQTMGGYSLGQQLAAGGLGNLFSGNAGGGAAL